MAEYKKGLDFFRHDTNMSTADQAMELMEAEFGLKGYAIYIKLLEKIYGENGYYMDWNKDIKLLFARRVGEPGSLIDEVLSGLLRRGLFNKSVFKSFDVLTSKAIQSRYLFAAKRREKVVINKKYLLLPPDEYKEYSNVNIINSNVDIEKQRTEENRTEQESTEKDAPPDKSKIPELQEVKDYFKENGYDPSVAEKAYSIYNASLEDHPKRKYWRDSRDNIIKNWKLKMQSVWFTEENKLNGQNVTPKIV